MHRAMPSRLNGGFDDDDAGCVRIGGKMARGGVGGAGRARDQTEGDDDGIEAGASRKIVFFFSRALFGVNVDGGCSCSCQPEVDSVMNGIRARMWVKV